MVVRWTLLHLLMKQEQSSSMKVAVQIQDFSHPPNLQLKTYSQKHGKHTYMCECVGVCAHMTAVMYIHLTVI
jgi:hypothetical protein